MIIAKPKKIIAPAWLMQSRCLDGKPKVLQSGLCRPSHRSEPRLGSGRGGWAFPWGSSSGTWATAWYGRSPPPSNAFTRRRRRWTGHFGELKLPAHLHRPFQRHWSEVSEHVEEHLVWELCHSCHHFRSVSSESPFSPPAFCKRISAWKGSDFNIWVRTSN